MSVLERMASAEEGYIVEDRGLRLLRPLETRAEWVTLGRVLTTGQSKFQWAQIDWMLLHRGEWGERWLEIMTVTGLAQSTCQMMARIGEVFPQEARVVNLPLTYYRYATSAPAGDEHRMLVLCAAEGWNIERFIAELQTLNQRRHRESGGVLPLNKSNRRGPTKGGRPVTKPVRCPKCQHVFPVKGNRVKGVDA